MDIYNKVWLADENGLSVSGKSKNGDYEDALEISKILLNHDHDLIHKAVGWMLREVGNRDYQVEYGFLVKYYREMPRTMLRYSIEKFDKDVRQKFLKGEIN